MSNELAPARVKRNPAQERVILEDVMIEQGTVVKHKSKPEWGLGVITAVVPGGKVEVAFEGRACVLLDPKFAAEKLEPISAEEQSPAVVALRDPAGWKTLKLAPDERPLPKESAEELTKELLCNVRWSFMRKGYESQELFCNAVRTYNNMVLGEPAPDAVESEQLRAMNPSNVPDEGPWRPDEVVLSRPRVQVQYLCWRGSQQIEPVISLTADNSESFTAGELLYKVHNAVWEDLYNLDHHFFEGFSFGSAGTIAKGPRYFLLLGS